MKETRHYNIAVLSKMLYRKPGLSRNPTVVQNLIFNNLTAMIIPFKIDNLISLLKYNTLEDAFKKGELQSYQAFLTG